MQPIGTIGWTSVDQILCSTAKRKKHRRRRGKFCSMRSSLEVTREGELGDASNQSLMTKSNVSATSSQLQACGVEQKLTVIAQEPTSDIQRLHDTHPWGERTGTGIDLSCVMQSTEYYDNNSYIESPQMEKDAGRTTAEQESDKSSPRRRPYKNTDVHTKTHRAGTVTVQLRDADRSSGCSGTTVQFHFRNQGAKRDKVVRVQPTVRRYEEDPQLTPILKKPNNPPTPDELVGGDEGNSTKLLKQANYERHFNESLPRSGLRKHENLSKEKHGTSKEPFRTVFNPSGCRRRRRSVSTRSQSEIDSRSLSGRSQRLSGNSFQSGSGNWEHDDRSTALSLKSTATLKDTEERFLDTFANALNEVDCEQDEISDAPEDSHSLRDPWLIQPQRCLSPSTTRLLKAVEDHRVIDSISRKDLKRELRKGLNGAETPIQSYREAYPPLNEMSMSARNETIAPKLATAPNSTPSHAPENHESNYTNQAAGNATHMVIYYPTAPAQYTALQPFLLTDVCANENWTAAPMVQTNVTSQANCPPLPVTVPRLLPLPPLMPSQVPAYYTYTIPTVPVPVPQPATYLCNVYSPFRYRPF